MRLNGADNGRRSLLKIALLALAILAAGILLYRQVDRWTGRTAWVAKAPMARGAVIERGDLRRVRWRGELPAGAVEDRRQILGRSVTRDKAAGDPFLAGDLADRPDPGSIALRVPEGRVLYTLRVPAVSIPYPDLRRGDRLEVVAVGRTGSGPVANDAFFIGWIKPAPPEEDDDGGGLFDLDLRPLGGAGSGAGLITLMLALHPQDVIPVARAQARQARLSLALQGHGGRLELPSTRADEVELIAGARREKVRL